MSTSTLAQTLEAAVRRAGSPIGVVPDLTVYLELLKRWNVRHNLTGLTTDEQLVRVGVADSLRAAPLLPGGVPALDVGSGAGLPAIVLAVLDRARPWWLIEPRRKRASFLLEVVHELALSHVQVVHARLEQLAVPGDTPPTPAELVTSRAVRGIDAAVAGHLRPGGIWIRAATPSELAAIRRDAVPDGFTLDAVAGAHEPPAAARWVRLRRHR